jgi:hypothetical protein
VEEAGKLESEPSRRSGYDRGSPREVERQVRQFLLLPQAQTRG